MKESRLKLISDTLYFFLEGVWFTLSYFFDFLKYK